MTKNAGVLLILVLCVSLLGVSGCFFTRVAGPCYGVGCPAFTSSGTQKTAVVPQPASGNAQAQNAAAAPAGAASPAAESSQAAPAQAEASQEKPGRFTRMLTALHLHSKS
jgi:hypothetical protein